MRLKRFSAIALSAVLMLSSTACGARNEAPDTNTPTSATALSAGMSNEEDATKALERVALAVKSTLKLSDSASDFSGEPSSDMLGTKWDLTWEASEPIMPSELGIRTDVSGDYELRVDATAEGKILSLEYYMETSQAYEKNYDPKFPAITPERAKKAAKSFMSKVLTSGETLEWDEVDASQALYNSYYRLEGTILVNELPSPLSFTICVDSETGTVRSFYRDDESEYIGKPASPQTVSSSAAAAELLKGTMSMRLEYVQDEKDGPAVLRYIPEASDTYYVDAKSGELVNLTELRSSIAGSGTDKSATMDSAASLESTNAMSSTDEGASLTDTELEGIAKLEGIMDQTELDAFVRQWSELNLNEFSVVGTDYYIDSKMGAEMDTETEEEKEEAVIACVSYAKNGEEGISRRTINVNAKTGELLFIRGSNAYNEANPIITLNQAQSIAGSFAAKVWAEDFAQTELETSVEADYVSETHDFTFTRKVNGYFFPANSITVRVSALDGAIVGLSKVFDNSVVFEDTAGIISAEDALNIWADSYPVKLSYIDVPVSLNLLSSSDDARLDAFVENGYSYYSSLKLGYPLGTRDKYYTGVSAKTGELVESAWETDESISYSDISGHWAENALSGLAMYNIGWTGENANPDMPLSQKDCLALYSSAASYMFEDTDSLYNFAYRMGFLTSEERDEEKTVTYLEAIKMLVNALGYKELAQANEIFVTNTTVAEEDVGYAAIARGLNMIGEGDAYLTGPASRATAAVILYNYMSR